ncbi:MAG: formylglycine-generating enzyme family protein [Myxococcota bacterium]
MLDDGGVSPKLGPARAQFSPGRRWIYAATLLCLGCAREEHDTKATQGAASVTASSRTKAPSAPALVPTPAPSAAESAPSSKSDCPSDMALVRGGRFWVGSEAREHFSEDESPRFLTEVVNFCADLTEVTVAAYNACVERGACTRAATKRVLCNASRPERGDHPINCVTFTQAEAYCTIRGARLPTEIEWEYMARGGNAYLKYPWGDASPDGRACWKRPKTCPVKSFAAAAFGLFDISGNVWEWTDSWYGAYPWPPLQGYSKVYRGGSFSRRFEKWMHTRLRNRSDPDEWGAHLGFRCVKTLPGQTCPFGADSSGHCLHGVLDRECSDGRSFNGVRCVQPGEPRCRPGRVEKPGFGCVLPEEQPPEASDLEAEARNVTRERTPEFDNDCQQNQPTRPHAFRYASGTHEARNLLARRAGCKNRDVGVGWNSVCCP